MSYETILISHDSRGVATLTLNRPDKHNALNAQMIAELTAAASELAADAAIRAVILTGAGKSFCAGGDLAWMRAQTTATRAGRIAEATKLAGMLKALNELPKPLIGRVQGQAFGGGMGMMSVCDVTIAVTGPRFGFTEVRLGLIPATISPYVVACMGLAHVRGTARSGPGACPGRAARRDSRAPSGPRSTRRRARRDPGRERSRASSAPP